MTRSIARKQAPKNRNGEPVSNLLDRFSPETIAILRREQVSKQLTRDLDQCVHVFRLITRDMQVFSKQDVWDCLVAIFPYRKLVDVWANPHRFFNIAFRYGVNNGTILLSSVRGIYPDLDADYYQDYYSFHYGVDSYYAQDGQPKMVHPPKAKKITKITPITPNKTNPDDVTGTQVEDTSDKHALLSTVDNAADDPALDNTEIERCAAIKQANERLKTELLSMYGNNDPQPTKVSVPLEKLDYQLIKFELLDYQLLKFETLDYQLLKFEELDYLLIDLEILWDSLLFGKVAVKFPPPHPAVYITGSEFDLLKCLRDLLGLQPFTISDALDALLLAYDKVMVFFFRDIKIEQELRELLSGAVLDGKATTFARLKDEQVMFTFLNGGAV